MGRIALIFLLKFLSAPVFIQSAAAENISRDIIDLSPIVITGTRTEKTILETPVRTEVVIRKEIERTHASDLKEALEDVPGLLIKPNEKNGFNAWLQGMDANRVLVVIDGEPISPSTGSSVDLSQIGAMDIERIEIVKGATSALYGSNAMGGVINIITRKPSKPLNYQLSLDGGSYGDKNLSRDSSDITARNLAAHLAVKRDYGYLKFNTDLRDKDGYTLDQNSFRSEGSDGLKANANLRLAWTPSSTTEIYLAPRYYQEKISNFLKPDCCPGNIIKKQKNEDASRFSTTLGVDHQLYHGGQIRGWLFKENWRDITEQDVINTPQVEQQRNAEINTYRAELQWDQPLSDNHLLTWGVLYKAETLNQYQDKLNQSRIIEVDGEDKNTVEAYLQSDIFLGEQWELVPRVRIQNDNRFGFYAAPKINAMYTPEWFTDVITNVRMGIGRGYRSPDLKEQYYVFDHSQLGYMVLGSPDVRPESSDSYQLGIEFAKPGEFRADITLFHNRIKDLIETRINGEKSTPGLTIYDYSNYERAMTQGLELSNNLYLGRFDLKGSYTFLDSEDRITGKTLKDRPRHMVKLGIDWHSKISDTTLTLRSVYQSEEFFNSDNSLESPAWTTWDIKVTQKITPNFSLFGGIDNLTDEHRDTNIYYDQGPKEGRLIYMGVRLDG